MHIAPQAKWPPPLQDRKSASFCAPNEPWMMNTECELPFIDLGQYFASRSAEQHILL
jgi:hypothetical protein